MRNSYTVHDTTEVRRRIAEDQPNSGVPAEPGQPAAEERSWIVRALSWLGGCILEGYAIYGQSICPCLVDFPEYYHPTTDASHWPEPALPLWENPWEPSVRSTRDIDIHAWLASAPSCSPCGLLDLAAAQARRDGSVAANDTGAAGEGFDRFR